MPYFRSIFPKGTLLPLPLPNPCLALLFKAQSVMEGMLGNILQAEKAAGRNKAEQLHEMQLQSLCG